MLTIEIAKGDILGTLAIALTVGWMGVLFLGGMFVASMMGERPRGWEWLPIVIVPGVLSAIGWVEWWVAQWFIRA